MYLSKSTILQVLIILDSRYNLQYVKDAWRRLQISIKIAGVRMFSVAFNTLIHLILDSLVGKKFSNIPR